VRGVVAERFLGGLQATKELHSTKTRCQTIATTAEQC
jgi:hypothetical protein